MPSYAGRDVPAQHLAVGRRVFYATAGEVSSRDGLKSDEGAMRTRTYVVQQRI